MVLLDLLILVLPSIVNTLYITTLPIIVILKRLDTLCMDTLNKIGLLERTLHYYHHATPGEPCRGSPGVAW